MARSFLCTGPTGQKIRLAKTTETPKNKTAIRRERRVAVSLGNITGVAQASLTRECLDRCANPLNRTGPHKDTVCFLKLFCIWGTIMHSRETLKPTPALRQVLTLFDWTILVNRNFQRGLFLFINSPSMRSNCFSTRVI